MKAINLIGLLISLVFLQFLGHLAYALPQIGEPAPDFSLQDISGKEITLSSFRGKIVVLEWINHGCPFVIKHYKSGNMQALQREAREKGVVWLSICSSAPGKQGHMPPEEARKKNEEVGSNATTYLIDENGQVGKLYGAKVTPELFIINPEGVLVYHGAIDSIKSTNPADIPKAKNYVRLALEELFAGKRISEPTSTPYGCSIKYEK
ncbi:MAG: thioredoxin family protein [Chthoniobacterales bacterium]|nr:thioredoxin family protein [Chthoniobacterales bacterium]